MEMASTSKYKGAYIICMAIAIIAAICLIAIWCLNENGLYLVHTSPSLIAFLCLIGSIITITVLFMANGIPKRTWIHVLCILLILLLIVAAYFSFFIQSLFGSTDETARRLTSPSGKNELVIMDSGFIDAYYKAYPMVNAWMYRKIDNGFISYHDFWGDVYAPEVTWVSDTEARITLDVGFLLAEGSAKELIVLFDD